MQDSEEVDEIKDEELSGENETNVVNDENQVENPGVKDQDSADESNKLEEKEEELRRKQNEIDGLKDKLLRQMAEFDNYKKRTVKEKESLYVDAKLDALKDIIPVLDNLERAFDSIKSSGQEDVLKGLEMVIKQFQDTLTKMGVEHIDCLNQEFNPDLHNAVMHADDDSESKNVVIEEFQKGYKLGDKVIRHSMVKVLN